MSTSVNTYLTYFPNFQTLESESFVLPDNSSPCMKISYKKTSLTEQLANNQAPEPPLQEDMGGRAYDFDNEINDLLPGCRIHHTGIQRPAPQEREDLQRFNSLGELRKSGD